MLISLDARFAPRVAPRCARSHVKSAIKAFLVINATSTAKPYNIKNNLSSSIPTDYLIFIAQPEVFVTSGSLTIVTKEKTAAMPNNSKKGTSRVAVITSKILE